MGSNTYTLAAIDVNGCSVTDQFNVNVVPLPVFSAIASPNPLCLGNTGVVVADNPNLTYQWSGSDIVGGTSGQSITINPVTTESYDVSATDFNGCTAAANVQVDVQNGCCSTLPPPSYTISGSVNWTDQTFEFDQDLIILPNSYLTALRCTLKFASGTGIIVKEGSRLTLNESYATILEGCDGFWNGISATHDAEYSNNLPIAMIYFKQAVIEKANVGLAITTITNSPQTVNHYHNWIDLLAENSIFLNNKQDLRANGASGSILCNSAKLLIRNCKSVTDLGFPLGYMPNQSRIDLTRLLGTTRIENCEYSNLNPNFLSGIIGEYTAIKAFSASLNFYKNILATSGSNSISRISGFTRGIKAQGTMNLSVNGSYFANWRSIYTRAKGRIKITDSDFENIPLTLLPAGNQIYVLNGFITPEGTENVYASPYGIYIDQSKAPYFIFDCTFQTELNIPNPPLSHGIVVNDTGDINNRIRRNDFNGMDRALKIQGDNRTSNNLYGLRYSCNHFTNNMADIQELPSNGTAGYYWGLPHQFSGFNKDPKNTFSVNLNDGYFDDIHNLSTHSHNYMKIPSSATVNPNPVECDIVQFVQTQSDQDLDNCINESGLILSDDNNNSTLYAQKSILESAFDELIIYYKGKIDGGETNILLSDVESANFSNALFLYYSLLEKSPFLSEDVLVKALRNCNIPNYLLAQILASNPFAAKSEKLIEEVSARPIPFEQYEKEQINEGLAIWSSKEQIEASLASYIADRDYLIREIFWRMDTLDSVPNFNAKLAMLDETKYPSDHLWKMSVLEDMADYSGAMVTLANAEILLKDLNIEMDAMLNDALEVEDNYSQNGTLDESDITTLFRIMKEGSATSYSMALDLLIQDGQIDYTEPIEEKGNSLRTMKTKTEQNAMLYSFEVYPNPASSAIVLDLHGVSTDKVEIRSATGQLLLVQSLTLGQNKHQILLDNLNSGVFEVRLIDSRTKKLYCKSLIVNK